MFPQKNSSRACRAYEARLEDRLAGVTDVELDTHLRGCPKCREALGDARMTGTWLQQAWDPAQEPSSTFAAGVLARVRAEAAAAESPVGFWNPLEFLASRLSLTAAMLLLALSAYLVEFAPRRAVPAPSATSKTEISAADFPQPPNDPAGNDEVLRSLAEGRHGR